MGCYSIFLRFLHTMWPMLGWPSSRNTRSPLSSCLGQKIRYCLSLSRALHSHSFTFHHNSLSLYLSHSHSLSSSWCYPPTRRCWRKHWRPIWWYSRDWATWYTARIQKPSTLFLRSMSIRLSHKGQLLRAITRPPHLQLLRSPYALQVESERAALHLQFSVSFECT